MNNLTHEFALCDIDVDEKLITQTVDHQKRMRKRRALRQ